MNLGHTCLFHKWFCTVYFCNNKKNAVTLIHIAQRKHVFLENTKEKAMSKKVAPISKVALEVLHQRLGHRYTRSLMNFYDYLWQAFPETGISTG